MRNRAFPKIYSREDALSAIAVAGNAFLILVALQLISAMIAIGNRPPKVPVFTDTALDRLGTAAIFAVLASMLHRLHSRVIAVTMFLLVVLSNVWGLGQGPFGALGGVALMIGLWAGVRAMQATFKFHYFARGKTTDSASRSTKGYDIEKWEALLKYDKDIAMVAQKLRPLGEKWVDEFARAFLILNDERYLPDIVQRIIADAKEEAERAERSRQDWHSM
jgi:hypothetical protein